MDAPGNVLVILTMMLVVTLPNPNSESEFGKPKPTCNAATSNSIVLLRTIEPRVDMLIFIDGLGLPQM